MFCDRRARGPRDPGLAGQSDPGGRLRARRRRLGPAAVPSGASTGSREALELRDGGKRYRGKGVLQAVANVHDEIAPRLRGMDARDQARIDRALIDLDGTAGQEPPGRQRHPRRLAGRGPRRRRGRRACRSTPTSAGPAATVLPVPLLNVLNGGAHADNSVDIQEFMLVPIGFDRFSRGAARRRRGLPHAQGDPEEGRAWSTAVGDEGGFAPDLDEQPRGARPA